MSDLKKIFTEFGDASKAMAQATHEYRKAASLAYNEGGRIVDIFAKGVTNGNPIDLASIVADLEGCTTLGLRAKDAEVKLVEAERRYIKASDDMIALLTRGRS